MRLMQRNNRRRVLAVVSGLLLFSLPTFAGVVGAQTLEVGTVAIAHPLLAEPVPGRDADAVQVRAADGQPVLAFDATDLDFGTTAIGDSSGWRMTVLTNTGTADATALAFDNDPEFPFPPIGPPCYGWSALPAGGACLIVVKFAPVSTGQVHGTLGVSSAEGASASLDLTGVGDEESVLYGQFHDWTTQPSFIGLLNSHFLSVPSKNSEFADDFEVEARSSWTVSSVGIEVVAPGRPTPPSVDVYVMPDANGVPGETPVCAAPASQFTLWEPPVDETRAVIQLSSPCTLAPGHYWLQVILTVDSDVNSLYWGLQFVQKAAAAPSGDLPPMNLHSPVWRNPAGGTGYPGCSDWTPVVPANCSLEDYPSDVYTFYGSVFWIIGHEIPIDAIFANGFEVL